MAFIAQKDLDCFVDNLNLMDDILFQKVAEDPGACEELLQTILEDDGLTVEQVVPQRTLGNLVGRSVVLDALCTLGDGSHVAVEVQKRNDTNHFKRVRYVRSSVDTFLAEKGIDFADMPLVTVVFASSFDPFKAGRAVYHVRRYVEETMQPLDDGALDVYVNAAVDDGTKTARLMAYMADSGETNAEFPRLSRRVQYCKDPNEGRAHMGDLFEAWLEEHRDIFEAEGLAKGMEKGLEKGMEKGLAVGMEKGLEKGMEQGKAEGMEQGLEQGKAEGTILGSAQAILGLMETMGLSAEAAMDAIRVPEQSRDAVMACLERKIA